MMLYERFPPMIAELGLLHCRIDNVSEQDRGQDRLDVRLT